MALKYYPGEETTKYNGSIENLIEPHPTNHCSGECNQYCMRCEVL